MPSQNFMALQFNLFLPADLFAELSEMIRAGSSESKSSSCSQRIFQNSSSEYYIIFDVIRP